MSHVFGKGRFCTTATVVLLLLPLLSVISYEIGIDIAPPASAASDCGAGEQPGAPDENKVEDFTMTGDGWDGDEWGDDAQTGEDEDFGKELTYRDLSSLTSSFYTSFVLNNDSAVGLRMNLTTGWKYTICIDLQPLNGTDDEPLADVYLLQENDYSAYEFDFDSGISNFDSGFTFLIPDVIHVV